MPMSNPRLAVWQRPFAVIILIMAFFCYIIGRLSLVIFLEYRDSWKRDFDDLIRLVKNAIQGEMR